jgi:NAD(P)-dependent dehydrogenase (short-subunit alcohol dehydrogenase family)
MTGAGRGAVRRADAAAWPTLRPMDISGASGIVTGGASGLGEATVRALAQRGVRVVVLDMADERGEAVAKEVGGVFAHADVTNAEEVTAAVEAATELGPLRVAVNCAGVGSATRTIGRDGSYESAHDLQAFRRVLDINLVGTFNVTRLAASAMSRTEPQADNERGAIVNVASVAAFDGQIGQVAYSASKGGVVGMTLTLARDLAVVGIRVNTIAPGLIDTPIYGHGPGAEEFKAKLRRDVLYPERLGEASEFAHLVLELLTNSYMNAEVIRIDGGARLQPK